jgi:hypothetical protein
MCYKKAKQFIVGGILRFGSAGWLRLFVEKRAFFAGFFGTAGKQALTDWKPKNENQAEIFVTEAFVFFLKKQNLQAATGSAFPWRFFLGNL